MSNSQPVTIKLLTLGNVETGKTTGNSATIRNKNVKVNIFDTSGDPVFFEVRNEFYRDCEGVLLVFDLKNRKSFDALDKWLFEMKSELRAVSSPLTARFCVCGNKVDQTQRVVSYFEASQWCANNNLPYFETSALTGHGVTDVINTLLESILEPDVNESFAHLYTRHTYQPNDTRWSQSAADSSYVTTTQKFQNRSPPSFVPDSDTLTSQRSGLRSEAVSSKSTRYTPSQFQAVNRIRQAKTHQERLGVGFRSTNDEINRAYRKLAFTVHPDKNFAPGSEEAFKLLVSARTALIQPGFSLPETKFRAKI